MLLRSLEGYLKSQVSHDVRMLPPQTNQTKVNFCKHLHFERSEASPLAFGFVTGRSACCPLFSSSSWRPEGAGAKFSSLPGRDRPRLPGCAAGMRGWPVSPICSYRNSGIRTHQGGTLPSTQQPAVVAQ